MSDVVGGVHGLYDKVLAVEAAGQYHIVGNYKGSLLTFRSKGAFIFGVLHCFGNLSLMTMVPLLIALEEDGTILTCLGHRVLAEIFRFASS